jgi:hypothetical protein
MQNIAATLADNGDTRKGNSFLIPSFLPEVLTPLLMSKHCYSQSNENSLSMGIKR